MTLMEYTFLDACEKGCLPIVKLCIEEGIDINKANGWCLIYSAFYNQYDVVKYLLDIGVDLGDRDIDVWKNNDYDGRRIEPEMLDLIKQYK